MAKQLEELTIVDDFMFGAVMKNPKRCKPLLEYILGVKIKKIEYPELQKTIDKQYKSKSVRLDVYVEDDKHTVYNIEIQTTRKKNLPKRLRYYQGIIDLNIIDKGEDYTSLKKSFVIFICTYDPFGAGRYIYTFRNRCDEDDTIFLGDEATKIVLNAKGTKGDISKELKDTLDFIAGKAPQSEYAKDLQAAVEEVKQSKEWRREYMLLMMRDKEQQKMGVYRHIIAALRINRETASKDLCIKMLNIDEELYEKIVYFLDKNPDWNDEDIAEAIISEEE